MPEYAEKERFSGSWNGEEISANRTWGGHRFTDQEVADLLDGEMVVLENLVSTKTGNTYSVRGRLAHQSFNGDDGKEQENYDKSDYKIRLSLLEEGRRHVDYD